VLLCALLLGASSGARAESKSPEDVVRTYLTALKGGDFATAYDCLTSYMVRNQDKATWVREQSAVMKLSGAKINSFQIFPAKLEGDKATVPNLLKSSDNIINQTGEDEYELYTLTKNGDQGWKIDRQQLVETDAVSKWFPPSAH